jgi:hypothetical protein
LLAIDYSFEIFEAGAGLYVWILFIEPLAVILQKLIKFIFVFDVVAFDFPHHERVDRISAHNRIEQNADLMTAPNKFALDGWQ